MITRSAADRILHNVLAEVKEGLKMPKQDRPNTVAPPAPVIAPMGFVFAGVCFSETTVNAQGTEVQIPTVEFADRLKNLTRRELEGLADECKKKILAKDNRPIAVVGGVRRPFAHVLLEQVTLALAGGSREV